MSILLSTDYPAVQALAARPRLLAFVRAASIRAALIAVCAVVACQVIPGDADPTHAAESVKGVPSTATHVGEFSGSYHNGLPVYLFPTIRVVGQRSAD